MNENELKVQLLPCPWCGDGDGVLSAYPNDHATSGGEVGIPHVDSFFVHCDGCGADGPVEDTHGDAIEAWNTRQAALAHASSSTTNPQESSSRLVDAMDAEIARLNAIINTPQADDFLRAVSTEAEHQRQRWGNAHDSGKAPSDWFWLIGYLAGKALHAHAAGNVEKAEHHVITTAAVCANWHRAMFGKTDMRPGIDGDAVSPGTSTMAEDASHVC